MTPVAQCQPKPVCATCATPTCGCAACVARRNRLVTNVTVNGVPAGSGYVPPAYNMVIVPTPADQRSTSLPVLQGASATPTTAEPTLAAPANPYAAFIDSVQSTQEKDARAIQEIMDHRQANLAVIRSMQAADANAVEAFEKLVHQMKQASPKAPQVKEDSPKENPVPALVAAPDTSDNPDITTLPAVPVVPVVPVPQAVVVPVPAVVPAGPSPKEIKALMEELERLSQKVKELSSQPQPPRTTDSE